MSPIHVELLGCDGVTRRGKFFLPTQAARHAGPMRLAERMNEEIAFMPFLPDDEPQSILINKRRIVAVSVAATDDVDKDDEGILPRRRVTLTCGARSFEGEIVLDMPQNQIRVLDFLNHTDEFVMLSDGTHHHFVQKAHIDCVIEQRAGKS